MMKHVYMGLLALGLVAGCSNEGTSGVTTGFAAPDASGAIPGLDRTFVNNVITSSITGNAFAYEVGAITEDGFHAYSGLVPGTAVTPPPSTGQATYTGVFFVGFMGDLTTDDVSVTGIPGEDTGSIVMDIDFANGAMTAQGIGIDDNTDALLNGNAFEVTGTFSGTQMTGTATYNGVSGPMEGLMGGNEAIGVFHGESNTQLHAGGFGAH